MGSKLTINRIGFWSRERVLSFIWLKIVSPPVETAGLK
jgi:hypothetical protein